MAVPSAHDRSEPTSRETRLWLLRAAKVVVVFVYAFVLVNLVMLTLGFALRLFGASTDATFTRWVYRNVDRIMEPFRGMFPSQQVSDHSVLDVSLLFAMIVYLLVGIALHAVVVWVSSKIVVLLGSGQAASGWRPPPGGSIAPPVGPPGPGGHPASSGPGEYPASPGPGAYPPPR